jgi:hypothetical protein
VIEGLLTSIFLNCVLYGIPPLAGIGSFTVSGTVAALALCGGWGDELVAHLRVYVREICSYDVRRFEVFVIEARKLCVRKLRA